MIKKIKEVITTKNKAIKAVVFLMDEFNITSQDLINKYRETQKKIRREVFKWKGGG
jgi:hypothetical protein